MRYHVNPKTGRPGQCKATFTCPFGDLEKDHYASKEAAQAGYETRMADVTLSQPVTKKASSLGKPITIAPSKLTFNKATLNDATYSVDYDYDSYHCSDPYNCGNDGDYCRDSVYEGLRVEDWSGSDGLADFARYKLGIGHKEPLPPELVKRLEPFKNFEDIKDDFDIYGEPDYYGDTVKVDTPPAIASALKDYFYSQPNAVDRHKVLPYLRGKGLDTTNLKPLDAIKESLRMENNGRLSKQIASAKSFKVSSITLSKIAQPNASKVVASKKAPKPLDPVKQTGQTSEIAGVVMDDGKGGYVLVDGYGRYSTLKNRKKVKGNYIVLSTTDNSSSRYYSYSSRYNNDHHLWDNE